MTQDITILVENLSKQYRLGEIGTGTLQHDLNRWWHKIRGKADPYAMIGTDNVKDKVDDSDYVFALKDINIKVKRGEVLGIIGKNGSGKSTLLKVLTKVTGPTSGRITMQGRVASLLEVGTGFHPELTGRENIYLNGAILGMSKTEIGSKIDEIVKFSGIAKYVDTPVKRYSSGMKVRLGFAVAAHLEPEILIVDEVLAVGDIEFQNKAVGKMKDVSSKGGRTVLFVSHNMGSIKSLCTRCILLNDGKIIADGHPDEIVNQYLDLNIKFEDNVSQRLANHEFNKLRFTSIGLENLSNPNMPLVAGESIKLNITYESIESIDAPSIIVKIKDRKGREVIRFITMPISGFKIENLGKKGEIGLIVKDLNLTQGLFYIDVGVYKPGMAKWIDYLENIITLNITECIPYASNYLLTDREGVVYYDHEWSHETY